MISKTKIVARLILAAIIGGLIGAEREASNRPAGLRTHTLVSIGSALIMLISIDVFYDFKTGMPLGDPARLAAQVVSGIGFLGAGTIMRTKNNIRGLTTAASLWVCAGIGLAIGSGYYLGGLLTTGIVLLNLISIRTFEKKVKRKKNKTLEIVGIRRQGLISEISNLLEKYDAAIKNISIIDNEFEDDNQNITIKIHFRIKTPRTFYFNGFIDEIYQITDIVEVVLDGTDISYNYLNKSSMPHDN